MIVCPFSALTRYQAVLPGVEEAMALIAGLKTYETAAYPISNGRVMVSSGTTMPTENAVFEAHRQYLDIQYLVKGHEVVGWAPLDTLTPVSPFDTDQDRLLCGTMRLFPHFARGLLCSLPGGRAHANPVSGPAQ